MNQSYRSSDKKLECGHTADDNNGETLLLSQALLGTLDNKYITEVSTKFTFKIFDSNIN